MQGNLNEIDIRSILLLIELGQRTGQLFVKAHSNFQTGRYHPFSNDKQQSWFVFFLNGQIIYATNGDNSLSRLSDYLRPHQIKVHLEQTNLADLKTLNILEYAYLWMLLEQNLLSPSQARSIIHSLVYETLFDLLNLQQGYFIFELSSALTPQLTSLEISHTLSNIVPHMQSWKELYPYIYSPEQIPVLTDIANLSSSLPTATVNKLQNWADGKTSLRQLARYLNRDIVTVAKAIQPYIQQGWMQLVHLSTLELPTLEQNQIWELEENRKRRIICIDNKIAICTEVETILKTQGYEAIALTNPLEALNLIFKIKPDLIFCDTGMAELEGYEICTILRNSQVFRFIPIIMLSDKEEFFDRLKAKMVGANDYLTKPFGNNELVLLVEKYLKARRNIVKKET